MTSMLLEYLSQVNERLLNNYPEIKFGMLNIEQARIIEARYHPLNPPDFKLF
jgi:hypothetical protein